MFVNRSAAIRLQIGQAFRAIVPGAFRGTCAGRSSIHSSSQKEFENGTGQGTRFENGPGQGTRFENGPGQGTRFENGPGQVTRFENGPGQGTRFENGPGQVTRSMDFVRGIMDEDIRGFPRNNNNKNWMPQYQVENNADILHIRMMRNNSKVTLTDSKGKVKFNISSGMLSGATKVSRYSAESASELAGRKLREMGIRSVVVKVNGFTFFKKKRQAILAVREGYTNNRGDKNPIVFIEDTTRKAHNGCRLPKQRRT